MTDNFKPFQLQPFSLAGAGASIGDSTVVLSSMLDINGAAVTMANFGTIAYGTLEPGNGIQEEQISFTGITNNANGTSTLTGVSTVLFKDPYTPTANLAKTHAGGTVFVISNTSAFYDQFLKKNDDATITGLVTFTQPPIGINPGGQPDASDTVKGVTKLSVAPVSATNPIAVGVNDVKVPPVDVSGLTANQVAALVGTGTPNGTTGVYVTLDTGTSTYQTLANISTNTALGNSNTAYPSQNAVKTYVDTQITANQLPLYSTSSANLRVSADTQRSTNSGAGTILKSIQILTSGTITTKYDMYNTNNNQGNARLYVNGVGVGTNNGSTGSYVTYTDTVTVKNGDFVQVFAGASGLGDLTYIKNFRLYFDLTASDGNIITN